MSRLRRSSFHVWPSYALVTELCPEWLSFGSRFLKHFVRIKFAAEPGFPIKMQAYLPISYMIYCWLTIEHFIWNVVNQQYGWYMSSAISTIGGSVTIFSNSYVSSCPRNAEKIRHYRESNLNRCGRQRDATTMSTFATTPERHLYYWLCFALYTHPTVLSNHLPVFILGYGAKRHTLKERFALPIYYILCHIHIYIPKPNP